MSRGELNARRSTVTLHMVSSLDGIIAKKDNCGSRETCGTNPVGGWRQSEREAIMGVHSRSEEA